MLKPKYRPEKLILIEYPCKTGRNLSLILWGYTCTLRKNSDNHIKALCASIHPFKRVLQRSNSMGRFVIYNGYKSTPHFRIVPTLPHGTDSAKASECIEFRNEVKDIILCGSFHSPMNTCTFTFKHLIQFSNYTQRQLRHNGSSQFACGPHRCICWSSSDKFCMCVRLRPLNHSCHMDSIETDDIEQILKKVRQLQHNSWPCRWLWVESGEHSWVPVRKRICSECCKL